jgi:hypothetical protein
VITDQYGFILAAVAYTVVYIKSFLHWRQEGDPPLDTPKSVRESIIKDIEALPIEPGLTNALGMKMMAIKAAKGE